ncbi:NAD(P)-binding domain-containing protein [Plantactinospora solaniradicis]|uniref:NAD(P)-binding domain-containing protein n=1 Tax=Plantactinospora solaniradicis TaxID=1723736 RepID=A0ABW1K5D8_9ACTN
MKVGLIGAGAIAQAVAVRLGAAGIEDIVLSNSRGAPSLVDVIGAARWIRGHGQPQIPDRAGRQIGYLTGSFSAVSRAWWLPRW